MTEQKPIEEWHEHPMFNRQYHRAVWVYQWASSGTEDKPPEDCPIVCAICGKVKEGK